MEKINLVGFPCFFPKWLRTISVKPSEEKFSRKHSPKGIGQNWPQNIPECSGSAWNGSYYSVFPNWLRIISETQWKKSEEKSAIWGRLRHSMLNNAEKWRKTLFNLPSIQPICLHSTAEIPKGFRVTEFITIVHSTKMVKGGNKNP